MKKLKIIIPVIIVIIAGLVAAYIFLGDNIAISGKSKAEKGFSKSLNQVEGSTELFQFDNEYKIVEKMNSNPFEEEVKLNFDIDIDNLEDLIGDEDTAKLITDILDELSNADLLTKVSMDKSKKQLSTSIGLNSEDTFGTISEETIISSDEMSFRSKEINENFLSIKKDDYESLEEFFNLIDESFDKDYSNMQFSDEEIEYFKETYGNVFDSVITDDIIKSEKGEFTVSDKAKSCTVTTVSLNEEKVKELLKKYVETFENDEKGRKIIEDKFKNLYGNEISDQLISQLDDEIDSMNDQIDEIEGISINFITYGSTVDVYGTTYEITLDESTLKLTQTYNSDNTKYVISLDDEEILNATLEQSKNDMSIQGNMDIDGVSVDFKFTKDKEKTNLNFNAENLGEIDLVITKNVKTNTDNEFDADAVIDVKVNAPTLDLSASAKINLSEKISVVKSLDLPDTSDAVSANDQDAIDEYVSDSEENINKLVEKLQKSDAIKSIMDLYSNYANSTLSMLDEANESLENTNELLENQTKEINKMLFETDINKWYSLIKSDDSKKSEIIEENMITSDDFSDDVEITTYISWEEDAKTDEGYLGVQVTDSDDNSYEYYLDLSADKVYNEDNVPFDTEAIEWNEY